ncbi:MAG: hypothetical protein AB8B71_02530 [Paracoccaceae bacterium]
MIARSLAIFLAFAAAWGLWSAYGELRVFRRTVFWEYRYIIFGVGSLLALGALDFAFTWLKAKMGRAAQDQ